MGYETEILLVGSEIQRRPRVEIHVASVSPMRRCLLLLELPSQCRVLVQCALSGGGWVGKGTGGVHTSGNQVDNSPRLTWQHCSTSLALAGLVGFSFQVGHFSSWLLQ